MAYNAVKSPINSDWIGPVENGMLSPGYPSQMHLRGTRKTVAPEQPDSTSRGIRLATPCYFENLVQVCTDELLEYSATVQAARSPHGP